MSSMETQALCGITGIMVVSSALGWLLVWFLHNERNEWYKYATLAIQESHDRQGELNAARATISRLEDQVETLKDDYASAVARSETWKCDLAKAHEELTNNYVVTTSLHDDRDHWRQQAERFREEWSVLKQRTSSWERDITDLREAIANHEENARKASRMNERLQHDLAKAETDLVATRQERDEYQKQVFALIEDRNALEKRIDAAKGMLDGAGAEPVQEPVVVRHEVSANGCCRQGGEF